VNLRLNALMSQIIVGRYTAFYLAVSVDMYVCVCFPSFDVQSKVSKVGMPGSTFFLLLLFAGYPLIALHKAFTLGNEVLLPKKMSV